MGETLGDGFKTDDEPSKMIAHEVGILGKVDSLQRQTPEPLPAIDCFILRRCSTAASRLTAPLPVHPGPSLELPWVSMQEQL